MWVEESDTGELGFGENPMTWRPEKTRESYESEENPNNLEGGPG